MLDERIKSEGRVKQAVKEALNERDVLQLRTQLSELKDQITQGFKGVHEKQDITNGKVLKSREDIIELRNDVDSNKDKINGLSKIMYSIAATVGLAVLAAILNLVVKQ